MTDPAYPDLTLTTEAPRPAVPPPCERWCGAAGSGKTYALLRQSEADPSWAQLCSTTGISAVNLGSVTINSLLRYSDRLAMRDAYIEGHLVSALFDITLTHHWLALEEYSMYDADQLDTLYCAVTDLNRDPHVPWPLGIILIGDLAQLPPVKGRWCFEADCWGRFAESTRRFDKIWRQDGGPFLDALNLARYGNGAEAAEILTSAGAVWHTQLDSEFSGTTIVDENKKVNRYNALSLSRVTGRRFILTSRRWGVQRHEWGQNKHGDWGIPPEAEFKIGAYVMILANMKELIASNGDCGYIEDYGENDEGDMVVRVRLVRNNELVEVKKIVREVGSHHCPHGWRGKIVRAADDDGSYRPYNHHRARAQRFVTGQIEYYPLRLGYASTVHKSQSLTLDRVQVDFRGWMFKQPAMLYTALSRCRTLAGLRLVGSPERFATQCRMDPHVRRWL